MAKRTGFGKSVVLYSIAGISTQVVNFFLLPVYTTYLNTSDYGILEVVTMFISFFIHFVILGSDQAIGRMYFEEEKEGFSFKKYLRTIVAFIIVWGLLLCGVLTLFGEQVFGFIFPGVSFSRYLIFGVWGTFLASFTTMYVLLMSAKEIHSRRVLINLMKSFFMIGLILVFLVGFKWGVFSNVLGIFIAELIFGVFSFYALFRLINFRLGFHYKYLRMSLAFSVPFMFFNIGGTLRNITDRIILLNMLSTSEVGLYAMGYKFGMIVSIFMTAWYTTYKFRYMRIFADDDKDKDLIVSRLNHVYVLTIGFIFLGVSAFTPFVIFILTTSQFHESYVVAPWIAMTFLINGFGRMPTTQILFQRKTKYLTLVVFFGLVVNVIFSIILIKTFGYVGAAIGTFISQLATMLVYLFISNSMHRYKMDMRFFIQVVVLIGSWAILSFIFPNITLINFIIKLIIFSFTIFILWILMGRWEKNYFWGSMRENIQKIRKLFGLVSK